MATFADGELSGPWAARVPASALVHAGRLRGHADVRVLEADDEVWLRGDIADVETDRILRGLPGARRYRVDAEGRAVPSGGRIPECAVPQGGWRPIREALAVRLPPTLLPGQRPAPVALRLCPGGVPRAANLLLTTLPVFARWALLAPEVRLRPLAFAVDGQARVVVRGAPVPPLPGDLHVEACGVAVPCGLELAPALPVAVVARWLGITDEVVVRFLPDATSERIDGFVRASRSAVRATLARFDVR